MTERHQTHSKAFYKTDNRWAELESRWASMHETQGAHNHHRIDVHTEWSICKLQETRNIFHTIRIHKSSRFEFVEFLEHYEGIVPTFVEEIPWNDLEEIGGLVYHSTVCRASPVE